MFNSERKLDYYSLKITFDNTSHIEFPDEEDWKRTAKLSQGYPAVYVEKGNIQKSYRISDECSIIEDVVENNNKVIVYFDSQAALKAIDSHRLSGKQDLPNHMGKYYVII